MRPITRLPDRPLRPQELAELNAVDSVHVTPYGGVPSNEEVRVYAIKLATDETAYALGFDDAQEQWRSLASADASDLGDADRKLDATLDEWAQNRYGGRFEVLKAI